MNNIHPLPPGVAKIWAERAKAGKADKSLGSDCYVFVKGGNFPLGAGVTEVCLVGLDPPQGHVVGK